MRGDHRKPCHDALASCSDLRQLNKGTRYVFDQDWSTKTQQGVVLEAAFHGAELKSVRLRPIRIVDQHQPRFADPVEASEILGQIWAASAALP